ncbi:MAG: hypothetical protein JSS87_11580 [Acidobacteria bacterium]|nr:hypothetical protein [Acidobacteriota bacterium]
MTQGTKVIVHFVDRTVKGHVVHPDVEEDIPQNRPDVIRIRRLDGILEEVTLAQTQGVSFVKEFEANSSHSNLLFYNLVPMEQLWVRITFKDETVIEGMVENGPHFVLNPGFMLTPTDPTGNSHLLYVTKTQLRDLKVLGLRHGTKKVAQELP